VVGKSYDEDDELKKKYKLDEPPKSKAVKMDMKSLITEIIPLCNNKLKVTMVLKSNPKLKFIPLSLLNFLSRKTAMQIAEKI